MGRRKTAQRKGNADVGGGRMKGDMMQIGPNELMYCIKVEDIFGLFHKKSDNLQRGLDESD